MPLICGFKSDAKGKAAFERLTAAEKEFLLTPPGHMLGIPTIMMATAIPAITKTSIPIMLARIRMLEPEAVRSICAFALKQIDTRDATTHEWKDAVQCDDGVGGLAALKASGCPNDTVYQDRILEFWFDTRYYGCTANVAYESNREWIKRLRLPTPPPKADVRIKQELKEFWDNQILLP